MGTVVDKRRTEVTCTAEASECCNTCGPAAVIRLQNWRRRRQRRRSDSESTTTQVWQRVVVDATATMSIIIIIMIIIIIGVTWRARNGLLAAADEGAAGVATGDDVQWRGKLTKVAKIGHDLRRNAILSCRVHLRYCSGRRLRRRNIIVTVYHLQCAYLLLQ